VPLGDSSLPDRCGEGTELRDGVCVSTVERVECGEGTRLEDGTCVSTIAQTYFVGRFDGRGRAIRNLEVANPGGIGGLFYILAQGAVVQNLRLVDVDVVGGNSVGGLAGRLRGAWVYGVHVTGTINGKDYVGGLVGRLLTGSVETCYATGWVTGTLDVGGLIGRVLEPTTTIRESYASGAAQRGTTEVFGSLVDASSSYSVSRSYFLDPESDSAPRGPGTSLRRAEFGREESFDWDFTRTWKMVGFPDPDFRRPVLRANPEEP